MIENIEVAGRTAWFARPNGSPRGAVVVCHGGGGLGPHERGVIDKLAGLGFAALAPDLLGDPDVARARALSDAGQPVPDELRGAAMTAIRGLVANPAELRARVNAAVEWVRTHTPNPRATPGLHRGASAPAAGPRVAVVGHCFGGTAALEAARGGADVACAVAFHGGLSTPALAEPGAIRAPVLACCGAADPFCPREQRAAFEDEMTRAGASWQVDVYGGAMHGFTVRGIERAGCAYDEVADRRSWAAMTALLDETIGPGVGG